MDRIADLIDAYRARAASSAMSKLDALMDLDRLPDPRVVPFLVDVLADRREPSEVRIHVLKRLRDANLTVGCRIPLAEAILHVALDGTRPDVRLRAAQALAEFADIASVAVVLGGLALNPDEPIDIRYCAFVSLQGAGPTPACVALLEQLSADDTLGESARSLLSSWRLE